MRRWLTLLVLTATVSAGCQSSGEDIRGPIRSPAVNATTAPLLPRDTLELQDFTYERLQQLLRQLRGTPVVLNVWGSWCGPCREEGPRLAAAARRYGTRVQFLGLDIRDTRDGARAFIREMGWNYPSVFDFSANGQVEIQLGFFSAVPITLFYDRTGKRVDQVSGPVSVEDLATGIRKVLR